MVTRLSAKQLRAGPIPAAASGSIKYARVPELVYGIDLKSIGRKPLWVRLPPRAPWDYFIPERATKA